MAWHVSVAIPFPSIRSRPLPDAFPWLQGRKTTIPRKNGRAEEWKSGRTEERENGSAGKRWATESNGSTKTERNGETATA